MSIRHCPGRLTQVGAVGPSVSVEEGWYRAPPFRILHPFWEAMCRSRSPGMSVTVVGSGTLQRGTGTGTGTYYVFNEATVATGTGFVGNGEQHCFCV